jgi:hypothetical protein
MIRTIKNFLGKVLSYKNKEDQAKAQARHYEKNKQYYIDKASEQKKKSKKWMHEYRSQLKCEYCDENHPACLDFHHVNPKEKSFSVGEGLARGRSINSLLKEIQKCIVLCANCHRKLHYCGIEEVVP